MWNSWWLIWMLLMLFFLLPPIGYGWGYRGWGMPYPRYIQRRRSERQVVADGTVAIDHQAWGWAGDYVWVMFFIGMIWMVTALYWWR